MGNNISRRLVGSRSLEEDVPMPMPAGVIRKPRPYDEIYIPESEGFVMPMPEGVRRRRHPYDEVDIPGNEATSIPDELQYDPRTRELYEKAIKEGREEDSTLRVMVIGCFGQGKTSLTRRLTGQTLDRIETTDGIEVDTCTVHEDSKWKRGSKDYHESDYLKRIAVIANNTQTFTETALPKEDHLRSESKQTAYPEELSKPQAISEIEDNKEITDARSKTENFQVFKSELLKRRSLKQKTDDKCYKLNIWDFGGQFVYYATHQIFHSRDAVYLLVFNLTETLDSTIADDYLTKKHQTKSLREYLKFWINSVHSFVGSEDGYEPAVILVGTHKDKVDDDSYVENCFEEIRTLFDGRACLHHIQPKHFAISCLYSKDDEIQELRNAIVDACKKPLRKYIPAKWIPLEKALKAAQHRKIITWNQLEEINRQIEYPVQGIDQIKLFLEYHHAKGSICYFDDEIIRHIVVLDPQYLIDAFKCIVTSESHIRVRSSVRQHWITLCKTGLLSAKLLEEVWSKKKDSNFWNFRFELLEFLKRLRIISEVQIYDGQSNHEHESLGEYIVPSLIEKGIDMKLLVEFLSGKNASNVILGYLLEREAVLPTVFQKVVSAMIGRWSLVKFKGKYMLYENTVACEFENHAGILMLTRNRLELLVVNLCPPDVVSAVASDTFRRFVEFVITGEISRLQNKRLNNPLQLVMSVRCNHESHSFKGSIAFEKFNRSMVGKIPCPDRASHSLVVENIQHEWFQKAIMIDHFPDRRLSYREYSTLSMSLGKGWQHIGLQLGIDEITLQQIQMDNHGTDMQIYAMLKKWDMMNGDRATLNVLIKAIYNCGVVIGVNWDTVRNLRDTF